MAIIDAFIPAIRRSGATGSPSVPTETLSSPSAAPAPREFRRVIGYHNVVDFDASEDLAQSTPPSYEASMFQSRRICPRPCARPEEGKEPLPRYSCSVALEGVVGMKVEQTSPFDVTDASHWTDVHAILSGTVLKFHAIRRSSNVLGGKNSKPTFHAGRVMKAYTLQNAEIGMASDHPKYELEPKSQFVHMLPEATITRLQETEKQLFEPVRRHVIRLRVEAHQILLRLPSSEERGRWLEKLCAAVDIAAPLEERTEPKYHTLPRRRRRQHAGSRQQIALAFAASLRDQGGPSSQEQDNPIQQTRTMDPDAADIDAGQSTIDVADDAAEGDSANITNLLRIFNRGDALCPSLQPRVSPPGTVTAAPPFSCQAAHPTRMPARIYPDDFSKWQPQFLIDTSQQVRYKRHCMPNLLYMSKRASDTVIKDGRRWRVDWTREELLPWPEMPPTYQVDAPIVELPMIAPKGKAAQESAPTQMESTPAPRWPDLPEEEIARRMKAAAAARRRNAALLATSHSGRPPFTTSQSTLNCMPLHLNRTTEQDSISPGTAVPRRPSMTSPGTTPPRRPSLWARKLSGFRSSSSSNSLPRRSSSFFTAHATSQPPVPTPRQSTQTQQEQGPVSPSSSASLSRTTTNAEASTANGNDSDSDNDDNDDTRIGCTIPLGMSRSAAMQKLRNMSTSTGGRVSTSLFSFPASISQESSSKTKRGNGGTMNCMGSSFSRSGAVAGLDLDGRFGLGPGRADCDKSISAEAIQAREDTAYSEETEECGVIECQERESSKLEAEMVGKMVMAPQTQLSTKMRAREDIGVGIPSLREIS